MCTNTNEELNKRLGLDKYTPEQLFEMAWNELNAICNGKKWRMSVPVQGDDSDIIIGEALMAQRRENTRLHALLDGVTCAVCGRAMVEHEQRCEEG